MRRSGQVTGVQRIQRRHVCAEELKEALGAKQQLGTCAIKERKLQRRGRITLRMICSANSGDDERNTAVSIDFSSASGLAHTLLKTSIISVIHVNVHENTFFYLNTVTVNRL